MVTGFEPEEPEDCARLVHIRMRLAGALTGPAGAADFAEHALEDLEFVVELLDREIAGQLSALESKIEDAEEERDQACRREKSEQDERVAAEKRIESLLGRLDYWQKRAEDAEAHIAPKVEAALADARLEEERLKEFEEALG